MRRPQPPELRQRIRLMSPEERQMLTDLFERVRGQANAPRDRDAEALIADAIRTQPYAPYLLTQAVLLQVKRCAPPIRNCKNCRRRSRTCRTNLPTRRRSPRRVQAVFSGACSEVARRVRLRNNRLRTLIPGLAASSSLAMLLRNRSKAARRLVPGARRSRSSRAAVS